LSSVGRACGKCVPFGRPPGVRHQETMGIHTMNLLNQRAQFDRNLTEK
jgi:hypothetical protein